MHRAPSLSHFTSATLLGLAAMTFSWAAAQVPGQALPSDTSSAAAPQQDQSAPQTSAGARATKILGLCDDAGNEIDQDSSSSLGLNDRLWAVVQTSDEPAGIAVDKSKVAKLCKGVAAATEEAKASGSAVQLDASQYALFFNGREVAALDGTVYDSVRHAFGFHLARNDQNKPIWTDLLGSPTTTLHRPVVVALGIRSTDKSPLPTISGDALNATFQLRIFSWQLLLVAVAATAFVLYLVWGHAKKRSTLRDNLLPQLDAARQPYSLARWQIAFWFTLIFASFLFLLILLWDTNTISAQALSLMGIAGVTGLASVAVDAVKDSPADAANRGLQALGLNSYEDVTRVKQEIADRQAELSTLPAAPTTAPPSSVTPGGAASSTTVSPGDRRKQLVTEIQDRNNVLRTYEDKIKAFVSQGWFTDITTDLNGTALHRLQSFIWTIAVGVVFLISVYRDLSMPDLNTSLLTLMGISGAGYVGFKIPESNN
jgi:hypothetical protein